MRLKIQEVNQLTAAIRAYELVDPEGGMLPAFEAGAHLSFTLDNGMSRSYSLANAQAERHRYVIAVACNADGQGGSAYIHAHWKKDDLVQVSAPQNHFPLRAQAGHVVLIAGGIGITPIRSMLLQLVQQRHSWELHYGARSRDLAAYAHELAEFGAKVRLYFDDEPATGQLNLEAIIAGRTQDTRFYCCGPAGMLDAFERAALALGAGERAHIERFSTNQDAATSGQFKIKLARQGKSIDVMPGQTILTALRAHGIAVTTLCEQGVCGSCETRVLAGTPDHRDTVLTKKQRRENQLIMVCCSGSLSPELELDL